MARLLHAQLNPNSFDSPPAGASPPSDAACEVCRSAAHETDMLLCDECNHGYHTFCLKVRLVPEDSPLTHTL